MAEDWIVGRKEIINALNVPLRLPSNPDAAWRKIKRWKNSRNSRGMAEIFKHLPSGVVYMRKADIDRWLDQLDDKN